MDRTTRQMAKWIYAGRGKNFHFSVANCMPRPFASGAPLEFSDDISWYLTERKGRINAVFARRRRRNLRMRERICLTDGL